MAKLARKPAIPQVQSQAPSQAQTIDKYCTSWVRGELHRVHTGEIRRSRGRASVVGGEILIQGLSIKLFRTNRSTCGTYQGLNSQ